MNECLKLEAPETTKLKKNLYVICQVTLSSSQISGEVMTKVLLLRGTGMIIFLRWMPKIYIFSAAESEQMLFGGWASSYATGDKKAQNGSSVSLHAVSHTMPQRLQNVIKKKTKQNKKGMSVTEILNICSR